MCNLTTVACKLWFMLLFMGLGLFVSYCWPRLLLCQCSALGYSLTFSLLFPSCSLFPLHPIHSPNKHLAYGCQHWWAANCPGQWKTQDEPSFCESVVLRHVGRRDCGPLPRANGWGRVSLGEKSEKNHLRQNAGGEAGTAKGRRRNVPFQSISAIALIDGLNRPKDRTW